MSSSTIIIIALATSSTGGGWTAPAPSDMLTMQAVIVSIMHCFAMGAPILLIMALLWTAIKKIWTH